MSEVWKSATFVTTLLFIGTTTFAEDCEYETVTASQQLVMCAQDEAYEAKHTVDFEFFGLLLSVSGLDDIDVATSSPEAQPFIQSQKDWTAFLQSTCLAEAELYDGGTLQDMFFANCETRHSETRRDYLRELRLRTRK